MNSLTKRIVLYELKISTFFDSNNSGYGNFNGILKQLNYFKKLNVNVLAIDNVLNQYQNGYDLDLIKNRYGSIKDFVNLIKEFRINGINIAPIIDLVSIKQSYINWRNMMNLYNLEENKLSEKYLTKLDPFLVNKNIEKTSLSEIANFIRYFEQVLDFYLKLNISALVLDNFEFLINNNLKEEEKLQFLVDLYKIIKRKKPEILIILKSNNDNIWLFNKILHNEQVCLDYLYLNSISIINNKEEIKHNKEYGLNFKYVYKIFKDLSKSRKTIISLGSDQTGRLISKWGDEKGYYNESVKTLFSILYASNNSIGIYYGDEIGILRAKINRNFDFNNEDYNEEKRYYQSKNIDGDEYFNYQSYFNKWTSYTWMPWNDSYNSGSSKKSNSKIYNAFKYKDINVKNQIKNKDSALNYVYFLNKLIFNSDYSEFLNNACVNISYNKKGIFKITKKLNKRKMVFLINMSNKHRNIIPLNDYSILSTSYSNKFYSDLPKELSPFESLILFKEDKI
ncbi:glucan 1,6-alpha-glucosidase [Metamycoplasma phocicerebrale]|uniref:Glucan 1,6-alpha-glucosidase n=1 Tax=Metamycoplasma phocicerebrale TaxID=142649 RepID=A0A3T0TU17_9BACT|nr:alpha-amylase family glycosyl hydrolase [Metamycoplasma phocicerebrale]AZZ65524.1 glucan 1,6-alpha-glucosidase [Metamycoplasma phocicerebrale]